MAKALIGHFGTDLRLASEVGRLRARVRELEAELVELRERDVYVIPPSAVMCDFTVVPEEIELERPTPVLA